MLGPRVFKLDMKYNLELWRYNLELWRYNLELWRYNLELWRYNLELWRFNLELWRYNLELWRYNLELWRYNLELWRYNLELWRCKDFGVIKSSHNDFVSVAVVANRCWLSFALSIHLYDSVEVEPTHKDLTGSSGSVKVDISVPSVDSIGSLSLNL
ncbi:hypothetical protein DPMN_141381 [Dreissena polymorpha]|uniref:Uncharacterized protein n=1 Tax=Dreissena polymorpha TaxID=45954 RepID=A0A9D4GCM6_DREPO|nr:hypothetical protein DPMN_141381 [Dreissena polymorpha]